MKPVETFEEKSIENICQVYTQLTKEDIQIICDQAKSLQQTSDLAQANIFIDCPTKDGQNAIVVAEASPTTAPSLYTQSVVGKIAYQLYEPAVILTHKTGKPTIRNRAITQEGKSVKQCVIPIKNKKGNAIGSLIMEQDISEQITHEKQLKALSKTTEQLSQTLIGLTDQDSLITDMIQESLFLLDPKHHIIYSNSYAYKMVREMGIKKEIIGSSIFEILPCLATTESDNEDVLFREVFSNNKTFEVKQIRLRDERKVLTGSLLLIRDLTELREKERQLMVKSTVIKEIHHRVKNNLQTVASLVRLQMKRGVPKESLSYFQETLNRIVSIAEVHEVLSNTGSDEVECLPLIEKIGHTLVNNHVCQNTAISIDFQGDPVILQSDKAVSLALVVHELIQNSIKHAFMNRLKGNINVHLKMREDQIMEVIVYDNGNGFKPSNCQSLGLEIVQMIVQYDLSGQYWIKTSDKGTKVTIHVPLREVVR